MTEFPEYRTVKNTLPLSADGRIINAMTVDVEDYYHAHSLEQKFPRAGWDGLERRVENRTRRLLDLFDELGVKATFFTLGTVALEFPALIKDIVGRGHELASHGFAHFRVSEQEHATFLKDVSDAKAVLEDAGGCEVTGYRAASFSIGLDNWWAFDVLEEAGYLYSSSWSNGRVDRAAMPIPDDPFFPSSGNLIEIPITTTRILGKKIPTGGGYFRLLPYPVFQRSLSRTHKYEKRPLVFYFHPWEIDPHQPRANVGMKTRVRHYGNLHKMERKIASTLGDFGWGRMCDVFEGALSSTS